MKYFNNFIELHEAIFINVLINVIHICLKCLVRHLYFIYNSTMRKLKHPLSNKNDKNDHIDPVQLPNVQLTLIQKNRWQWPQAGLGAAQQNAPTNLHLKLWPVFPYQLRLDYFSISRVSKFY